MTDVLVGDVGGTNIRLACVITTDDGYSTLDRIRQYNGDDFPTLYDAIDAYIKQENAGQTPTSVGLAVACPVDGDFIQLTNRNWSFSQEALKSQLNSRRLVVVNDFSAICYALQDLIRTDQIYWLNSSKPGAQEFSGTVAVFGPGTGLGVSVMHFDGKHHALLSGEGGHTSFAPVDAEEIYLLDTLTQRFGRVSNERLLSGPGLENLYSVLAHQDSLPPLSATEITCRALEDNDPLCQRALTRFCKILGGFGGDLALSVGADAVIVAGGMVPRFLEYFEDSPFLNSFSDKGRFASQLAQLPVGVITHRFPGLLGIKTYTMEQLGD